MKYPANMMSIRVMCSGRVDPSFIFDAFRNGADGVLICGCHPGDCHYVDGNYKCMRRVPLTKRILNEMGILPERLRLEWVSASEGARFQQIVSEFTEQIRALGPFNLKDWAFDPGKEVVHHAEATGE